MVVAKDVAVEMDVVATMDVGMAKGAVEVAEAGSSPWRKTHGPCCSASEEDSEQDCRDATESWTDSEKRSSSSWFRVQCCWP